ncbi:glycosyltransferase family 4 protein [Enterococcus hirae]
MTDNNKKEKVLIVGAVGSMIANFNMENIQILKNEGYEVEVAANFGDIDPISNEKKDKMLDTFQREGVISHQIDFQRGIGSPVKNIQVILKLRKLISEKKYKFIHTNSPLASALVRIANLHKQTKIIYTAHGFQFFKGGRKRDWLLFYPIERILASQTDVLVTINEEDYTRAKKMGFKIVKKIPGVGVDIHKFRPCSEKINNSNLDKLILLSVGELNNNKNHILVLEAIMNLINKQDIEYWICGTGTNEDKYLEYINKNHLVREVKLLGYRSDINDILEKAHIFVFPSFREGLSVSVIEAMAKGKPVLASNIRGNRDLIDNGKGGILFNPASSDQLTKILTDCMVNKEKLDEFGRYNLEKVKEYDIKNVNKRMIAIYRELY